MNVELLKNNVYLTLLAFYNGGKMPKYTTLSKQIGITRQTVSTKVNKLKEQGIISVDDNGILSIKNINDLDIELLKSILISNPNINSIDLQIELFGLKYKNAYDLAEKTGISVNSIYNNLDSEIVVYGIISEGVVKYVGSTKHYDERIKEHIRKRNFLSRENFIILKKVELNDRFNYEKTLIQILKPEWNVIGK